MTKKQEEFFVKSSLKVVQKAYNKKLKENLTPAQRKTLVRHDKEESFEKVAEQIALRLLNLEVYFDTEEADFKKYFKDVNHYEFILLKLEDSIFDARNIWVYSVELLTSCKWIKTEEDLNLLACIERFTNPIRQVKLILTKRRDELKCNKKSTLLKVMRLVCDSVKEREIMRPLISDMLRVMDIVYASCQERKLSNNLIMI